MGADSVFVGRWMVCVGHCSWHKGKEAGCRVWVMRELAGFCVPGQGAMLAESIWCPKGDVGACVLEYHMHHCG